MVETFAQRMIADGRITVPSHVRDELGVGEGDYLRFTVEVLEDG
jgi:AbrB family looped-hinge helix DNA binding protein